MQDFHCTKLACLRHFCQDFGSSIETIEIEINFLFLFQLVVLLFPQDVPKCTQQDYLSTHGWAYLYGCLYQDSGELLQIPELLFNLE